MEPLTDEEDERLNDLKVAIHHIAELTTELKKAKAKNRIFMATLKKISADYIEEGIRSDCPGCLYDGGIQSKTHDPECVYVIALQALKKAANIK